MADPGMPNSLDCRVSSSPLQCNCCHDTKLESDITSTSLLDVKLPSLQSCYHGDENSSFPVSNTSSNSLQLQVASTKERKYTKWTIQQRVYSIKRYYQKGTFKGLSDDFCKKYKVDKSPDNKVIKRWLEKFETYGTVVDFKKASDDRPTNSGRPKKRTIEVVDIISNSIEMDPNLSLRERAKSLGIPYTTLWRVTKEDIKKPPGGKSKKEKVKKDRPEKPKELPAPEKPPIKKHSYINALWSSDDSNFDLYGKINPKTTIFWG